MHSSHGPEISAWSGGICLLLGLATMTHCAEQAGLLSSSVDATDAAMWIHPRALTSKNMVVPTTLVFVLALVGVATMFGRSMRATERGLRRQLHLQAWQLRQLVTG